MSSPTPPASGTPPATGSATRKPATEPAATATFDPLEIETLRTRIHELQLRMARREAANAAHRASLPVGVAALALSAFAAPWASGAWWLLWLVATVAGLAGAWLFLFARTSRRLASPSGEALLLSRIDKSCEARDAILSAPAALDGPFGPLVVRCALTAIRRPAVESAVPPRLHKPLMLAGLCIAIAVAIQVLAPMLQRGSPAGLTTDGALKDGANDANDKANAAKAAVLEQDKIATPDDDPDPARPDRPGEGGTSDAPTGSGQAGDAAPGEAPPGTGELDAPGAAVPPGAGSMEASGDGKDAPPAPAGMTTSPQGGDSREAIGDAPERRSAPTDRDDAPGLPAPESPGALRPPRRQPAAPPPANGDATETRPQDDQSPGMKPLDILPDVRDRERRKLLGTRLVFDPDGKEDGDASADAARAEAAPATPAPRGGGTTLLQDPAERELERRALKEGSR